MRLEERLGYVHKGIESLMTGATLDRALRLAGRASGDSTVAYALAFAHAVEAALPDRGSPARHLFARADGRARAPRQSFRRHRRGLQRCLLLAHACALRRPARAGAARGRCVLRPSADDGRVVAGRRCASISVRPASGLIRDLIDRGTSDLSAPCRALRQHRLAAGPHGGDRRLAPSWRGSSAPAATSAAPAAAPSMRARRWAIRPMTSSNSTCRCSRQAT